LALAIARFHLDQITPDLTWEQDHENHHLLTWEDPSYPALLREIHDPPIVLYAAGSLRCLNNKTLGIVGTRNPSFSGREIARQFATTLAQYPLTIVSGLALGIDAEAHTGCLEANGQTIGVLGTGINRIYPYRHRALAAKIQEKGLIISEFPLDSPPNAGHFPRRNRIISGLSLATLVVEAAIKSGSLITARLALEQNREVMAIPGSIHNPLTAGCHHLLQQGAKLITSVVDIIDELALEARPHARSLQLSLAMEDEKLVNCLGFEVTTLNQIMARSGLDFETVACQLATLELKNVITAVPGGYMRCNL
jgi:DNA processing protein